MILARDMIESCGPADSLPRNNRMPAYDRCAQDDRDERRARVAETEGHQGSSAEGRVTEETTASTCGDGDRPRQAAPPAALEPW